MQIQSGGPVTKSARAGGPSAGKPKRQLRFSSVVFLEFFCTQRPVSGLLINNF